jgi:putative FmdB family regulatory protein
MPVYEYECLKCGSKFEVRHGLTERDANLKCPKCGATGPKRVFSTFSKGQPGKSCAPTAPT